MHHANEQVTIIPLSSMNSLINANILDRIHSICLPSCRHNSTMDEFSVHKTHCLLLISECCID
jgi:hypothetical protein